MQYPKQLLKQTVIDASATLFSDIDIHQSLAMIEQAALQWPYPLAAWRVREHRLITQNLLSAVRKPEEAAAAAAVLWRHGYRRDGLAKLTFEVIAEIADRTPLIDAHLAFLNALAPEFDGVNWADLCRAAIPETPIKALLNSTLANDDKRVALDFAMTEATMGPDSRLLQGPGATVVREGTVTFMRLKNGESGDLLEREEHFVEMLRSKGPERAISAYGSAAANLRATTFHAAVAEMAIAYSPEEFGRRLTLLWEAGVRADQLIKLLDNLHIAMRADPDNPRWGVVFEVIRERCNTAERTLAAVELVSGGARNDRVILAIRVAPQPLGAPVRDRLWEYAVAAHGDAPLFVQQLLEHGVPASTCPPLACAILDHRGDKDTMVLINKALATRQ
jgi:hypothetical protein